MSRTVWLLKLARRTWRSNAGIPLGPRVRATVRVLTGKGL